MNRRQFALTLASAPALFAAPSSTVVLTTGPGEPLRITGRILAADGKAPLVGARLYLYHTDAEGYYNKPDNDPKKARITGWVEADSQGRYEIRTIRPASYPNTTIEAHIHVHLHAPGTPPHVIDNYLFAGDKFLSAEAQGPNVLTLKRENGIWQGSRDIRLDPEVARRRRI